MNIREIAERGDIAELNAVTKLIEQAKEAFEFIDLALQYEDQNMILRSGVRMAEVRARAHTMVVEIKRLEK